MSSPPSARASTLTPLTHDIPAAFAVTPALQGPSLPCIYHAAMLDLSQYRERVSACVLT